MESWNMITVNYRRIPDQPVYTASLRVDRVTKDEEGNIVEAEVTCKPLEDGAGMEQILESLHLLLQDYPEAKVTMFQEPTRDMLFRRAPPRGFELDKPMVDLIRTDLKAAQEMFRPIERQVLVKPPRVLLNIKET